MKLKWIVITGAAAAFVAFSLITPPSFAGDRGERGPDAQHRIGGGHGGHHGPAGHLHKVLKRLDLSVEQRDQVESIFSQSRPQMKEIHQAMRANRDRLAAITPDDADYSAIVAEVSQSNGVLTERMTLLGGRIGSDVWAVLTEGQKARAVEIRAEMRAKRQQKMERRQQQADEVQ